MKQSITVNTILNNILSQSFIKKHDNIKLITKSIKMFVHS